MIVHIDDPHDPRLDDHRDLRIPGERRRRESDDFFVAEGPTVVRRLLASGLVVRSVMIADSKLASLSDIVDAASDLAVHVVTRDVMAAVVGFDLHRGVVASAQRPADPGLEAVAIRAAGTSGTVAVLEGLNDHENLGAIARSARAFGVQALVLDPSCADPWYRRTVRVSMGEIITLPVTRFSDLSAGLAVLRAHGITIAALTPRTDDGAGSVVDIHDWERPSGGVALVLGAEGPGLSGGTLAASDVRLRIPIADDVDSLNVGHAAAVAFALVSRLPSR